jgi:DNA-binding NarL/FixJ family response regulator
LLSALPEVEVCGEAADGVEAVAVTAQLNPDLVILDLSMPKAGGLSAARRIREMNIPAKILIYTVHAYPQLEDTIRAGQFDGFVLKSNLSSELLGAVRSVLAGQKVFPGSRGKPLKTRARAAFNETSPPKSRAADIL